MPDGLPQLLTLVQVAMKLSFSTDTVRSMVRKGRLRPVRLSRRLLFQPDDVKRLVDAATLPTQGEISTE